MLYQKALQMLKSIPYLSDGLDVGADFSWMSIMLPNGTLTGKPFKIIHSDPQSREPAVTKIKEAQEAYSLKSRCFLESTGIYHIPLLCFLRDKGFDCSVINPIITKNSTNMNVRKLMLPLRLPLSRMTRSLTCAISCVTTIISRICSTLLC